MTLTVFYAWQMDRHKKLNRFFIESALRRAIKTVRAELRQADDDLMLASAPPVEPEEDTPYEPDVDSPSREAAHEADADVVLQWGAQGEAGASLIGETILDRIERCAVFVADLTFVGSVTTADGRDKSVPNSNVLIEVGAAARTGERWGRMVLVLNTAYGPVDALPFDLKHRHCTVQYHLSSLDDPSRKDIQKRLAASLAGELRRILRGRIEAHRLDSERRDRDAAAALRAAGQVIETRRSRFDEDVAHGRFYGLNGLRAVLALTIAPYATDGSLDLTSLRAAELQVRFRPIGVDNAAYTTVLNEPTALAVVFSGRSAGGDVSCSDASIFSSPTRRSDQRFPSPTASSLSSTNWGTSGPTIRRVTVG